MIAVGVARGRACADAVHQSTGTAVAIEAATTPEDVAAWCGNVNV